MIEIMRCIVSCGYVLRLELLRQPYNNMCCVITYCHTAAVAYYAPVEAAAAVVNVNGAARARRRRCVMMTTKRSALPTEGVVLDSR